MTIHKGKTHIFTARDGEQNSVITLKAGQNETLSIPSLQIEGGELIAYGNNVGNSVLGLSTESEICPAPNQFSYACAIYGNEAFIGNEFIGEAFRYTYTSSWKIDTKYSFGSSISSDLSWMSIAEDICVASDEQFTGVIEKSGGVWSTATYTSTAGNLLLSKYIDCISGYVVGTNNTRDTLRICIKGAVEAGKWNQTPDYSINLGSTITGLQINNVGIYVVYGTNKISKRNYTGTEVSSISLDNAEYLGVNDEFIICSTTDGLIYFYNVSNNSLINIIDTEKTITALKIDKYLTDDKTAIFTTATEQHLLFYDSYAAKWVFTKNNPETTSNVIQNFGISDGYILTVDPTVDHTTSLGTGYFLNYRLFNGTGTSIIGQVKAIDNEGIIIENNNPLTIETVDGSIINGISSDYAQLLTYSLGVKEGIIDTLTSTTTSTSTLTSTSITTTSITGSTANMSTSLTTPLITSGTDIEMNEIVRITDTTDNTGSSTGSLQLSGGLSVAKNMYLNGVIEEPNRPYFIATKNANQNNLFPSVYNLITFETIDTNGTFASNAYTVPHNGIYSFNVNYEMYNTGSSWGATSYLRFYVAYTRSAVTTYKQVLGLGPANIDQQDGYLTLSSSINLSLQVGDTVEAYIFIVGSGGMDVISDDTQFSGFMLAKLS